MTTQNNNSNGVGCRGEAPTQNHFPLPGEGDKGGGVQNNIAGKFWFKFFVPATILFIFILDRLTKLYLPVTKYYNDGAAFGVLQGQTFLLSIFSAVVIITLIVFLIKTNKNLHPAQKLGISMIIGGTAGNLFDRVCYGYVIDFINLSFINFPVFNLADVFINVGAVVIIIKMFFQD